MKHASLFVALGLAAAGAAAQEVGNVLSSTPVIQQVAVPRQNCLPGAPVDQSQNTTGMGGLMGGIAGGALGSGIGHGSGTIAAVLLGTVGGALLGNSIEAGGRPAYAAPTCTTEMTYENRTVGYNVTYEYGGRQYSMQMPYDPGPTVRLQVSPVAQAPAPAISGAVTAPPVIVQGAPMGVVPMVQAAPVYVQPYAVYPPPYPVYYRPYYYPPVGVSIGFVGGFGHRHHRRWR